MLVWGIRVCNARRKWQSRRLDQSRNLRRIIWNATERKYRSFTLSASRHAIDALVSRVILRRPSEVNRFVHVRKFRFHDGFEKHICSCRTIVVTSPRPRRRNRPGLTIFTLSFPFKHVHRHSHLLWLRQVPRFQHVLIRDRRLRLPIKVKHGRLVSFQRSEAVLYKRTDSD